MKEIKYKHFTVQCALEEPVTTDNFFKYSITLIYNDGSYMFTIWENELSKWHTEALLSGNEEKAQSAIRNIKTNREYHVQEMKNLINKF